MDFLISDTFTDSLTRLTGDEQKVVKMTAFDLQLDPKQPGLQLHKLDRARDHRFWSVRVNRDIRLIVHKAQDSLLLCYADHHDDAYQWAERRRLETHPTTGAAQLVEVVETVKEVTKVIFVEEQRPAPPRPKPLLFEGTAEAELLSYGVPPEAIPGVRLLNEDTVLTYANTLPREAGEALLELAIGNKPAPAPVAPSGSNPFAHPDAQRRFRVMRDVDELERALDYPWDKWTVFLHPSQRQGVERDYAGPARVSGSAGTGKTIVALHRAVHLARQNPDARVLLTTFSKVLANALRTKLRRLIGNEPRLGERLEVEAIDAVGKRLYEAHFGPAKIASATKIRETLAAAAASEPGHKFTLAFLESEWNDVVDAWQLESWEAYRDVRRLGRRTRLPEPQRFALWAIFTKVRATLAVAGLITVARLFTQLAERLQAGTRPPYEFAVMDEAQDVSIAQLRFLAALGGGRPNALFFAGDLGQRIFQQPFSWKSVGVDVVGRSKTLQINYRTSHQIRTHTDRLLGPEVSDVDRNKDKRDGTISVFNGPVPTLEAFASPEAEIEAVCAWLAARLKEGIAPQEIAVIVRSEAELPRAEAAAAKAGLPFKTLNESLETQSNCASVITMHLAKGLEYKAVAVMACDEDVIPSVSRLKAVGDEAELEELYHTERHLLYVAATRARDQLLVTGVTPESEFLGDFHA